MATAEQPNVLFVFSDQHRASAMGCSGNDDVRTPNMDRLAREGTRMSNAYANDPVCGPSRACLVTGQYPFSHQSIFNDIQLPTDVPSAARPFNHRGYQTGYVGKWHLDGLPRDKWTPPGPRRQGFDDFWAAYDCSHDYFEPKYYRDIPALIEPEGYEPEIQTDLAMEFVDQCGDDPFCLFLSWGPPHDPYDEVPDRYRDLYDPDELILRPNVEPIPEAVPYPDYQGNDVRQALANYYAQVTALDDQLGRLLDHLDETGRADDTVVVYTADHGDMLWSQGATTKLVPWEESVNVPFLVRWPERVPAGATNESLLSTVDVAPTLLSLTGISVPDGMDGEDQSDAIIESEDDGREAVYLMRTTYPRYEWRAVRTKRFTYARLLDGSSWLLYDNENDPYQRRNLVSEPEYEGLRAELHELIDERAAAVGDPLLPGPELAEELGVLPDLYAAWFDAGYDVPAQFR